MSTPSPDAELQIDLDPAALSDRMGDAHVYSADFTTRRIYLVGELDEGYEKVGTFTKAFHILDSSPGEIQIWMSSPGGDEGAGISIFDTIRSARNKTTIIGSGAVQSMAALILQAADVRIVSENTRFMIHDGTIEFEKASPSTILAYANESIRQTALYYRLLAERSGQPISRVRAWGQKETYMSASQTVRYHFADAILRKRPLL